MVLHISRYKQPGTWEWSSKIKFVDFLGDRATKQKSNKYNKKSCWKLNLLIKLSFFVVVVDWNKNKCAGKSHYSEDPMLVPKNRTPTLVWTSIDCLLLPSLSPPLLTTSATAWGNKSLPGRARQTNRQTDSHADRRETPPHSFRQPGDVSASQPVCSVTLLACSGTSSCILLTVRQAFPVLRRPLAREDVRHTSSRQVLARLIKDWAFKIDIFEYIAV